MIVVSEVEHRSLQWSSMRIAFGYVKLDQPKVMGDRRGFESAAEPPDGGSLAHPSPTVFYPCLEENIQPFFDKDHFEMQGIFSSLRFERKNLMP